MKERKGAARPDRDDDVETTGHSWDGIEELNHPLPRWWLWIFYATIIWGVGYMVVYPAVPLLNQATQGLIGYDTRTELEGEVDRFRQANAPLDEALVAAALEDIHEQPELAQYATIGGSAVFRTFCSQCHGSGAAGAKGYPNLLDDDWLWGGSLAEIYHTVRHGVGDEADDETRFSEMPAYGEILEPDEIDALTHFVLSISGGTHTASLADGGRQLFADNCADCHGADGRGMRELGAPDLTDALWLFGGERKDIHDSIATGRKGIMPAWKNRLTEAQLRQVTFYVHQLGGGE